MSAPQPQRPAGPSSAAEFPVDPTSPLFVAKAVLISAAAGAGAGATTGWKRRMDPFRLGMNMSINFGIASLAFFGMREYLISPILLGVAATPSHARRSDDLAGHFTPAPTMWEVRTDRILDSALAGAMAGASLSAFTRGARTILPAAFTAALLAVTGQGIVNQGRVFRLEMLAKRARENGTSPAAQEGEVVVEAPTVQSFEDSRKPEGETRGSAPITGRAMELLSHVLPVKKLSDDEYLASLEKKRADVDKRIAEIDAEQLAMWTNQQREGK